MHSSFFFPVLFGELGMSHFSAADNIIDLSRWDELTFYMFSSIKVKI